MANGSNVPAKIPALGGDASLNRYLSEVRKFPILTPEQEYMLAKRYSEHKDQEAAAQLVTSHLRLVAKIPVQRRDPRVIAAQHTDFPGSRIHPQMHQRGLCRALGEHCQLDRIPTIVFNQSFGQHLCMRGSAIGLIGLDNCSHKRMAHHVLGREIAEADILYRLE